MVLPDTARYTLAFELSGGYSTYRNMATFSYTSISNHLDSTQDSCLQIQFTPKDSMGSKLFFNPLDSFYWGSPFMITDKLHPSHHLIQRSQSYYSFRRANSNYYMKALKNCELSSPFFEHAVPVITSYAQAQFLIVSWPMILQHGGETDHGMHKTWFLVRSNS